MSKDLGVNNFIKQDNKFLGIYRGKVVDNNDPKQQGRIKVEIYPSFKNIETKYLPWAVPAFGLFDGSNSGTGSFIIPKLNTHVFCFFENADMYQPVYFAEAPDGVRGLPTERTTNYPNSKVWKTSGGIIIHIDDQAKTIKLTHPGGALLNIDSSGNITIQGTTVNINP